MSKLLKKFSINLSPTTINAGPFQNIKTFEDGRLDTFFQWLSLHWAVK